MSTLLRTLRNLRKIGFKEYGHQMQNIGDTKAGTFIGRDLYGNKYYENQAEELPHYKDKEFDPQDPILQRQVREWEPKEHRPTLTWSRSGYKPYSTVKNKYSPWVPVAKARQ
ncbi:hypothetical protein N0V90_001815 [Kalmusia sp. IMI 367209]|nr:hypothetical protein N0V90_001815 [Kalmusia sp. IMI 367209]